ncbi:MAG: hypothetical protein FK732_10025, partial [Asgard group archaeon]|nr:hypothetical protein [Asgard group archaeon]
MPSRKNKVLFVFALLIISMNLFTLTQISGFNNNQFDNETIPPSTNEGAFSGIDTSLIPTVNVSEIPTMDLWDISINVTRKVNLYDFGYIGVNDTYQLIKHDNLTMPIFRFAYPKEWTTKLVSVRARTMWYIENSPLNDTEVYVEYENEDFTFYAVDLVPALDNSSQYYTVNVFALILKPYTVFEYVETEGDAAGFMFNGIAFNFSLIPHLTKKIDNCQASFERSENGGLIGSYVFPTSAEVGEYTFIYEPITNAPAYNFSESYNHDLDSYAFRGQVGAYLSQYPTLEAVTYKRQIILENWYWARVHEELTVESFGVNPDEKIWDNLNQQLYITFALTRFYVGIDRAENVKVSDDLGDLSNPLGTPDVSQLNKINIYLRVPLMGGNVKTFYIDYNIKLEDILDFEDSEFILNTNGMPRCDFHVNNFELEIVFPQGANFQYVSFGDRTIEYTQERTGVFLNIGRRQTINFNVANVTKFDNINLRAGYKMSDLAYFIQPLTIALIIFIACLIYIGVRILRKDVIEKVVIRP